MSSRQSHPAMRILVLSWRDEYHPEAGGAEVFLHRTTSYLAEQGHEVTVRSARFPGSLQREFIDGRRMVREGGRFTVYPRGLLASVGAGRRYDVILDVQNGVPFWSPLVTRVPVVSLVHHVHREQWSQVFDPRRAKFGWWLESAAAPAVYRRSRYIAVSEVTRRELVELGVKANQIDVIYSGVDPAPLPTPVPPGQPPSLVVLGRLVPHKRVELALDAVAELSAEFPTLGLDVLGQGYWAGELMAYADKLGIRGRVRFAGFVSEQEKTDVLSRADIALLPSLKEGWGLAIMEAGALGTPTIAFRRSGGVAESIVDGQTGILVEDLAELVAHIGRLLRDPGARASLGNRAREHSSRYTWAKTGAALEAVLLSCSRRQ